jgi:FtsP/CotA-like multicopper oxidase with cupredoxin domain
MPLHIISSEMKKKEKRAARYMQEIREIVKAGLSRRELMRMGLVAGAGGLAALHGCGGGGGSSGDAGSAQGTQTGSDPGPVSPPNTPFVQPLPIPPAMHPVTLDPAPTKGRNPAASAVTGFTEAERPDHQRWEEFLPVKEFESVERAVQHDFFPDADGIPPSTVWTFVEPPTGAVGPLWIRARYGEPIIHRVHNALPVENGGFGINQTSTHLHGGHTASESDGGPLQFYDAGRFKDYHYPNARPGFSRTHPATTLNGRTVPGDVHETQSFLWLHDHRVDFTASNTYKGLVSVYTLFSDDVLLDTGDETTGLRLPSGEFDIPMIFADKAFDPATGQLFFDPFDLDGFLGDRVAVNGKIQPFLEVKRRKYRFRLLVGGPSRIFEFFLSSGAPFIQLTSDGNLLPRPLARQSIRIEVAERVDVIVDFSTARIGDRIYLQNRLEQKEGRAPTGKIVAPTDLVEFRVVGDARDDSVVPATLLDLPDRNVPIAQRRNWKFDRSNGSWTVNNELFDPDVISAFPRQDTAEIWTFESGGGWLHPVHVHLETFLVLSREDEAPPPFEIARKDTIGVGDSVIGTDNSSEVEVLVQFRDFLGDYPLHCHNTIHEDHAMMIRFQVVP